MKNTPTNSASILIPRASPTCDSSTLEMSFLCCILCSLQLSVCPFRLRTRLCSVCFSERTSTAQKSHVLRALAKPKKENNFNLKLSRVNGYIGDQLLHFIDPFSRKIQQSNKTYIFFYIQSNSLNWFSSPLKEKKSVFF